MELELNARVPMTFGEVNDMRSLWQKTFKRKAKGSGRPPFCDINGLLSELYADAPADLGKAYEAGQANVPPVQP